MHTPKSFLTTLTDYLRRHAGEGSACAKALEPCSCGSIERMHVCGGIYLSTQPSAGDLEAAKAKGIRSIINMRYPEEIPGFDERMAAQDLRLKYYSIPWHGPDELTDDIFDRYRKMIPLVRKPVLIHCSSADRVGAFWLAYRVLDNGIPYQDALAEARSVGLTSQVYESRARDYIAQIEEGRNGPGVLRMAG
ncbi:hypothetical protein HY256_12145 [Candidatus Sumerlaeota bacterium]|nr:hypothetical protein [Candidatus Sumerlaeota bacterium]